MGISACAFSKEMPGEFIGCAAESGIGFLFPLVEYSLEYSLFCIIIINFMLFCKFEMKILRNSKALKLRLVFQKLKQIVTVEEVIVLIM